MMATPKIFSGMSKAAEIETIGALITRLQRARKMRERSQTVAFGEQLIYVAQTLMSLKVPIRFLTIEEMENAARLPSAVCTDAK